MKDKVMDALQRFSKAMFIPVLILPIAGILIAVGNLFTNVRLQAVLPFLNNPVTIGFGTLLSGSLNAILGNLGVIFCVGLSVGLANKKKSEAGFISLLAFLVFLNAMNKFMNMRGMLVEGSLSGTGQAMVLGVQVLDMGVFIGLLLGIVVAYVHNRFCETEFNNAFQIYGGTRFVFIVLIPVMVVMAVLFTFVWPYAQAGINALGGFIRSAGNFGLFIYGTLERLLLPFGLHHMLTIPMNYTSFGGTYTIATGVNAGSQVFGQDPLWLAWANDLINFKKAGDMAAYNNLLTTVTPARFKVGQMIGATGLLLGIALAMFRRVDADKRAKYKSMFISTALAVFLTGVTEPLEFMFMFCAMPLYIVYALLQGCAFAMAGIIHLRLHSFGNLEFITRIPMSLQAGLGGDIINFVLCVVAFFVIGYFVAYFMIGKLKLATPGRLGNYTDDNADDAAADTKAEKKADKKSDNGQAERIIALLGGRENIVLVDACMTRLRVTVKDPAKVADLAAWKAEGALSLLVKGDGIQAVYGPKADVLKSDINDIL